MVNGTVDKNNTCVTSKPDEETVKHPRKSKAELDASPSTSSETPQSSKSSTSGVSLETDNEKAGIGGEEVGSRAMAEVPTKPSLFCSVPLNKIRSVLSNTATKTDEDENSSKLSQISRKLLCLYCDRTFVSSNLRQKHVERCHSEKQSRRLSSRKLQSQFTTTACFHCDKLPDEHSLSQLFEHLISEHPQKYFGCLLCEERFLNQTQLNDHNTKLHHLTKKEHQKIQPAKVNEKEKNDKANKTFNSKVEESKDKEQKSKSKVKKKETTISKAPPRELRQNKKKVSIKASKVALKRSTRLQSVQNKVPVRKKRTKASETSKSEENTMKIVEKTKNTSVNPYPEFDNFYRVKKITDHSIDNLKISSLTFDDVFDKAFFNRIKCNIQENLLHHLDGKLFKNEESESRISNFEKNPPAQEVSSTSSENFGSDLSLNAITPVTSILTANFGEDLESQIEYGSKPSKKKLQIRQDPVRHKYVTRRKFQASIREHKENRDLSKLDMWTQLVIKDRQQKVLNCKKSAKEMLEYTTCDEYKQKIQRNELNRILDRRGPFEDLKEEASKKAALEKLNSDSNNEISEACFREVRCLMDDLLADIVKICSEDEEESNNIGEQDEIPILDKVDMPELPDYLNLRRTSSVPIDEEIDKSDKIALICSSQETENYELPTNTVRNKNEMVELSGEWARSRIYVCAACGLKVPNMKLLIDHKSMYHQNSWVQHYELVGNQSELYRHLCIPGLGKVGHIEETVSCKSWLKSESRVCTKCGKVCNSLSELHRHILECGGDWTWMLARKKCKYRPFGARKKRRGLVKRIRVSNQKTDQTEKKKYKKTFEGPRQRPSDADTIQRMLANLPPKRSSRKSICMKDGFTRKRQNSPKNKKQVMKCGKIVRHKSTYNTNMETSKNPKNKSTSVRQTLRSISRTLSSKILDTNSKLKVKRQMIQNINRRSPRKNSKQASEPSDQMVKNEENEEKVQDNTKTTTSDFKNKKKDLDKVKSVLKEKVNIKSFFPVSKRKAPTNNSKTTETSNPDTSHHAQNNKPNEETDTTKQNTTRNVIKAIKKSLNFNKKVKSNTKTDSNSVTNSEPIVVIEKLPQAQAEVKQSPSSATKKAPNKRKLRSSFRKVIDKVKKLKLDNNAATVPNDKNNEINKKPVNSFLGQGAREKEKLATVLVPLVEESKETPVSNLAFVQNVMDNNSPTEESLIPENIFNLQHNSEDLLQAKSPLDTLTNEVRKDEVAKYLNSMSAKVSHIPESKKETSEKPLEINIKSDVETIEHKTDSCKVEREDDKVTKNKDMSLLSIETSTKSDKSPLVSPILSPSLLSPKMKGKLRKPNRGLNDCIAMLTKKAFEETHKTEIVPDSNKPVEKQKCLDNTNEAHKVIRANECILKIPVIENHSQIQSEVLDLSKPKSNIEPNNSQKKTLIDFPTSRPVLWNPVNDILSPSKDDSSILWPILNPIIQTSKVNCNTEKPILKIPKIAEISRSNNVDNTIQGVIENYDEPVTNSEPIKPCLKVPSILVLNSVDEIIEEVVRGGLTLPLKEENLTEEKSTPKDDKIIVPNATSRSKKATRKNKQNNISSIKDKTSLSPPDTTLQSRDQPESLDTSASNSTLIDSSRTVESMESMSTKSSEIKSTEEISITEELVSAVLIDETKISINSEILDENIVNVGIGNSKKKKSKKVVQVKKGTEELSATEELDSAATIDENKISIDSEILAENIVNAGSGNSKKKTSKKVSQAKKGTEEPSTSEDLDSAAPIDENKISIDSEILAENIVKAGSGDSKKKTSKKFGQATKGTEAFSTTEETDSSKTIESMESMSIKSSEIKSTEEISITEELDSAALIDETKISINSGIVAENIDRAGCINSKKKTGKKVGQAKKGTEEPSKPEELDAAVLIDETKISINSEIPAENTINTGSDNSKKKTGKKVGQRKKGANKKAPKNTNNEVKENNLKLVESDEKVGVQNSTETLSLLQTEETQLGEIEPISTNDDGMILEQPTTTTSLPDSVITESPEEDSPVQHNLEEISKKESPDSIEENENKEISMTVVSEVSSTTTENENKTEEISVDCVENNFKSIASDSEDELPLLLLKSRSTKPSLTELQEESTEKNEITVQHETVRASLESNSENCKKQIDITINEELSNTPVSENSPAPKEKEQILHSDANSEIEHCQNNPSKAPNKRTSPRKVLNTNKPNKQEKSIKKVNKSKHSSKIKNNKHSDDIIDKNEVLENISNTIETVNTEECPIDDSQKEKLDDVPIEKSFEPLIPTEKLEETEIIPTQSCADKSDVQEIKNIPVEEIISLKPSSPLEVQSKPKNFLVDANVYINNTTNTISPSINSSKTKKKNKNKQDSIKTKLIFKFPKIILKEPILRIPPRDNTSEGLTAFGTTTEENRDQDKSIKLRLENPFSKTKVLDDKLSPISTKPEILGKSETPLKIKSSNKKKSNKHKKRLLKTLAREGNLLDFATDEFQDEASKKSETSPFVDENQISAAENFQSPPADSNIPSILENSTKISTDSLSGSCELQNDASETSKKLPITLKLTPNSLKKSKSKNSKKKKDKVKKLSINSDIINNDDKTQAVDNFSISDDSHILSSVKNIIESADNKGLSLPSNLVENPVADELTISKSESNIEFQDKVVFTSTPEIPHKTFIFTSQKDQEKMPEVQASDLKSSLVSPTEKIEVVNEGPTPIKTSRSLRSTVKITYKQSNIFALQIEDKEISDLKIIEKPKIVEPPIVSSDNFPKMNPNIIEEHEEHISSKEESLKQEETLASIRKRSTTKKVKNNHQEVVTPKEKVEETIFGVADQLENEEKAEEIEDAALVEAYPKLEIFEKQETVKDVKTKSKKSRRTSRAKKLSNKISEIDSTIATVMERTTDNEKNEDECLNDTTEKLGNSEEFSVATQDIKQLDDPVNTSPKYEDLSFSEGELVINESFESMESNLSEESTDNDKKLEMIPPEPINSIQENFPSDSISVVIAAQNKSQKSKKHKKGKSAKFSKNSNLINNSLKLVETDQDEPSSAEINENSLSESNTKMELLNNISKSVINNFKLSYDSVESANGENIQKPKDAFEFEEEIEPIDDLKSKFKSKKIKDFKPLEIEKLTTYCEGKIEETTSTLISSTIDMHMLPLDTNNGRRQRTAKSRALESINIIEKKFDQLLEAEILNKEKPKQKNKTTKIKESITETETSDNTTIGMSSEEPLDNEQFRQTSNVTPLRKSRAAKAKAIENIKVSEIKASDSEGVNEIMKKTNISDSSEKAKKSSKLKEKKSSNMENEERNLLNHENNLFNDEQMTGEENKNKISSELFPTAIEGQSILSKEVHKSINETKITEMNSSHEEFHLQCYLTEDIKKNISADSVFKIYNKEETIPLERNKPSKSSESKLINEQKIDGKSKNEIDNKKETAGINSTSFNRSLADSSTEIPHEINVYQKRKRGDNISANIEATNKTNEINFHDIDNIDKDTNFHSKRSSCSPSKKKKKSHKNDKKVQNDVKGKLQTGKTTKVKEAEDIVNVPKGINLLDADLVDSLDVTLKTTVDEISSILMEEKNTNEIPYFENTHTGLEKKGYDKNPCVENHLIQKPHGPLDRTFKNKKNKEDIENSPLKVIEKSSMADMDETVESGSKRRSRRACKVNTYNENILAEAVFEQVKSEKNKADKKISDEITYPSDAATIKKIISEEVIPEKKMNSDELFDLLKSTAPDNLIALKPVENPSDTPHTDDNFDDAFDDILMKSQALFGEKPYKKLDDISRSDDSLSTTSKLTDFDKLDENSESNIELRKQSYVNETTFTNAILPGSKNEIKKPEEHISPEDLYCGICKKTFKRMDNLIKHRTTLTHIAKLSEMEAREAQNKSMEQEPTIEDSCSSLGATVESNQQINSSSYSYPSNTENNALKIAEIITEAFEKPSMRPDQGFSELVTPMQEYRRYKSLGERKSFEYDQGSPNTSENRETNSYEPNISNNTGVMLEKQINLLQNIVGFDCANDASTSSYHSLGNSIGRDSPVSVFSSKLEDSTNLVFPNDMDLEGDSERRSKDDDFLKPPQIEDISEDSINLRNSEDVKSRKVLNRDEELFLECCSLLKSGSEVSNFSKKSNRNSFLNNASIKMAEEPDVLETKNVIYKVTEDSSDFSARATPLGDSFGDTSNSNTISSSWETNKNDLPHKNQENPFNFCDVQTHIGNDENSFSSSKFNELVSADAAKLPSTNIRKPTTDLKISTKEDATANYSSKMPTKGALKTFEGLKISIPTGELNLDMLKKKSLTNKEKNVTQKGLSEQQFVSPKTPRRKSKPVKNKPPIDDRFIFKVNKKPSMKDSEETNPNISKESVTDKIADVYDFEETQDNTDVFAKPDFKSFRTKGAEAVKGEINLENNYEIQNMSSSSSSTFSGKKTNECITKKKHMIMGRIFKNAVKPKLEEEIIDIPPIDHNELVENYVMSCTPKPEEEFKKPKMTEEEMNFLFDKLLDKPIEQPKRSSSPNKTDCKNTAMKKKLKMKCKKRQRSNSDSTDDEFGLNKIVKKRPSRKNAKEEDNSINLEQELKECIGVASRKSQRKCTSGKQNVLVEYWSSDESAFETFLENHLQELSEKSDTPMPKDAVEDKKENEIVPPVTKEKENPTKIPTSEKNKRPKTKHKVLTKKKEQKDLTTSNETTESLVQSNRRKRTAAHPLYHWSSSSEDELQDLIEVKSIRDDPEDEYDEERPVQHGWIVGDSPKKLVTMLAQAKGKKTEPESFVKEQGKKKNSNS